jgi:hypothetical protein
MKKPILAFLLVVILLFSTTAFVVKSKYSTGIAGYTGSPSEGTCSSCHGGGTSAASGITITSLPAFTGNQYIPGTTYTITVDLAASGFNKFGFGSEILNSSNINAGVMQNPGPGVKFLNSGARKNAVHTTPKNGTGAASFSFEWVAPTSGGATVFVGANAVNGTGGTGGDFTFNSSLSLTETIGVGVKEHTSQSVSNVLIFPNPVTEFTNLSYVLNKTQTIHVQLTDLTGKIVKEIYTETQNAGYQSKIIDLNDVSSGVYFIITNADNQKVSQKLITVN